MPKPESETDTELTQRVDTLEIKLAETEADIAILTTRVDELEARVTDLENN